MVQGIVPVPEHKRGVVGKGTQEIAAEGDKDATVKEIVVVYFSIVVEFISELVQVYVP